MLNMETHKQPTWRELETMEKYLAINVFCTHAHTHTHMYVTCLPLHGSEMITNGVAQRLWELEGTDSKTIFDRQSSTAAHLNSQKHRLLA